MSTLMLVVLAVLITALGSALTSLAWKRGQFLLGLVAFWGTLAGGLRALLWLAGPR